MSTPWPTLAHSYYHLSPPPTSNPLSSIRIWLLHSHIYQSKSNKTLALDVSSYAKLVNCVRDMDAWMLSNKLKLNKDKSEVLVISSSYRPRPPLSSVDICNETVSCSPSARNIGVIFDQSLCMVPHVNAVCQSSFFHLRNIGFIRKYLSYDAAKIINRAFVVSKLD